jgi:hypothetical protein
MDHSPVDLALVKERLRPMSKRREKFKRWMRNRDFPTLTWDDLKKEDTTHENIRVPGRGQGTRW